MFGRRKRKEADAEEAAREAERRAVLAKLAERPEHICPFLGLADERTEYIDGISDEHRCFAFGDPGRISAEQQTRVCQQRGYGNCPRYLRGVLVIPTEELEALRRRPTEPAVAPPPPPPPPAPQARSRRRLVPVIFALLLLVAAGGGTLYLYFSGAIGIGSVGPSPTATAAPEPTVTATAVATATASAQASETGEASPTPEPTPVSGDEFAFYEVSVAPDSYQIFLVGAGGSIAGSRTVSFDDFSFARATPIESNEGDDALWRIDDGDLAGWAYRYPESGDFRVRAVFFSESGERRSFYLEESELAEVPAQTPAPSP